MTLRKQSALSKHDLSNILKLQAAFCIQFITNEQVKLHMKGVDFRHFNTCCTFKPITPAIHHQNELWLMI